ncbi:MAG: hypothetical protein JKY95_19455, partial [Planctomycetaceae bacterium]|nr:hypothetical protein [Planctomycetaceae bacterium]
MFTNNNWQLLEERIGTFTTPAEHHLWGTRYIDDLICRDRSTTSPLIERLYAMQDANWNVTGITSVSGSVSERYEYDPYGNTTIYDATYNTRTTSAYNWKTTYCGYRWDTDSGLYQVRNRYYSPKLGTWITRDPIGYKGGINLYEYVSSGPIDNNDPLGLEKLHLTISFVDDIVTYAAAVGEGADITVVSYGSTLRIVQETAKQLLQANIDIEVIDVQSLLPFDINHDIVKSLQKTNKLLIIDEDVPG